MRTNIYYDKLNRVILENSNSKLWNVAVREWEILDVEEDSSQSEACICGKEDLKYLFTIGNQLNGNTLYLIGSQCIKKFDHVDLNDEISVKKQLFELLHAVENNKFLRLSSEFFTRKLLRYLLDIGAFKATQWNDYSFMLDMFNKKTRTEKQEKSNCNHFKFYQAFFTRLLRR